MFFEDISRARLSPKGLAALDGDPAGKRAVVHICDGTCVAGKEVFDSAVYCLDACYSKFEATTFSFCILSDKNGVQSESLKKNVSSKIRARFERKKVSVEHFQDVHNAISLSMF